MSQWTICFVRQMSTRKRHLFCITISQQVPYKKKAKQEWRMDLNLQESVSRTRAHAQLENMHRIYNWSMSAQLKYHMEERTRTLFYIYVAYYHSMIELRRWKGSVTYGLGADISLPHCLATGIWNLAHKSDLRAEISGSIVWYDVLAPRPEVLFSWYLVYACADTTELNLLPYSR